MVVDDTEEERHLVLMQLERARISNPVLPFCDGQAALHCLTECWQAKRPEEWPCLLLLDLHMFGTSGFDVLEWLQSQPDRHGLTVVIVSSSVDPREHARVMALGADAFLAKFPSAECLASIVRIASAAQPNTAAPQAADPLSVSARD